MKVSVCCMLGAVLMNGCASSGAYIPTGSVDYAILMHALGCEVKTVLEKGKKFKPIDKWEAAVSVVIEGSLDRSIGVGGLTSALPIFGRGTLDASLKGSSKFFDKGTVGLQETLNNENFPKDCNNVYIKRYNISSIGLSKWYDNVEHSIGENFKRVEQKNGEIKDNDFIDSLKFERKVTFVFLDGSVSAKLFQPATFSPIVSFKSEQVASITIVFQKMKPQKTGLNTVALDDATLVKLAKILGRPISPASPKDVKNLNNQKRAKSTAGEDLLRSELEKRALIQILKESDVLE